ncbi:MAG: hypothetical protein ACYSWQ_13105, partial [Planctomycetota bacterium]
MSKVLPDIERRLTPAQTDWLSSVGLDLSSKISVLQWARRAQSIAFESLENAIVAGGSGQDVSAVSVLRSDEIVWARAPAR